MIRKPSNFEEEHFAAASSRHHGPVAFDVRRVASLTLPPNPLVNDIAFDLKSLGVIGFTASIKVLGNIINYSSFPAHITANYYIHKLGPRSRINNMIATEKNKWLFSIDNDFLKIQWPNNDYKASATVEVVYPDLDMFPLRIGLAQGHSDIDLQKAEDIILRARNDLLATEPHWRLRQDRPAMNGLLWASMILSARGIKYEVQHELLGCTRTAAKRARERLLQHYGNRLPTTMVQAGFDGLIQPWHLDPKFVRFLHDT